MPLLLFAAIHNINWFRITEARSLTSLHTCSSTGARLLPSYSGIHCIHRSLSVSSVSLWHAHCPLIYILHQPLSRLPPAQPHCAHCIFCVWDLSPLPHTPLASAHTPHYRVTEYITFHTRPLSPLSQLVSSDLLGHIRVLNV